MIMLNKSNFFRMRDGIPHCEYLNIDEICNLLLSICTDRFFIY